MQKLVIFCHQNIGILDFMCTRRLKESWTNYFVKISMLEHLDPDVKEEKNKKQYKVELQWLEH